MLLLAHSVQLLQRRIWRTDASRSAGIGKGTTPASQAEMVVPLGMGDPMLTEVAALYGLYLFSVTRERASTSPQRPHAH